MLGLIWICFPRQPNLVVPIAVSTWVGSLPGMLAKAKEVWAIDERFSVWSGALATAGNLVFYGTLEGYLKAVDAKTGKEMYRFKTPSGIIGNVTTYMHGGKQYVAILSGIGGWAGIGMAAGLTGDRDGLGAVGWLPSPPELHASGWHLARLLSVTDIWIPAPGQNAFCSGCRFFCFYSILDNKDLAL